MITVRAGSAAISVCLVLLMAGCSREQQDWRSAEAADTIESYDKFIQHHPESELATQARARVAQLGEDRDWQHAGSADTVDAYREFVAQHPNGKWAQEAHIRIENFSLGEQAGTPAGPPIARSSASSAGAGRAPAAPAGGASGGAGGTGSSVASSVAGAVPGVVSAATAAHATPPGAPTKGFGIQLGAYSTEAGATTEWHLLTSRYAAELEGLQEHVVPADTPSGRIYRLQAVVGEEGRARSICDLLRRRGQACVAVLPH